MVRADCFSGLFGGFEISRRSRSEFAGGFSPPVAAKCVRTNSRILHNERSELAREANKLLCSREDFIKKIFSDIIILWILLLFSKVNPFLLAFILALRSSALTRFCGCLGNLKIPAIRAEVE